jgi:hypothetical protein
MIALSTIIALIGLIGIINELVFNKNK